VGGRGRLDALVEQNVARVDVGSVKLEPHVFGGVAIIEAVCLAGADTLEAHGQ
jgi:hypothetical protein